MHADYPRGSDPDAALQQWRRAAAEHTLVVLALIGLLPVLYLLLAPGQQNPPIMRVAVIVLWLLVLSGALLRQLSLDVRIWLTLTPVFCGAIIGLARYTGELAYVWLLSVPIIALVLGGPRSGRVAAVVSTAILVLYGVAAAAGVINPWRLHHVAADGGIWLSFQTLGWATTLGAVIFLLERFHQFQVDTLAAEHATLGRLTEEAEQRRIAHESLAQAAAERQRLEGEITRVAEDERRRLGQDLHDGVSQQLGGALLRCTALEEHLNRTDPAAAADTRALCVLLEEALAGAEEIARGLCPVGMDPQALGPALRALAERVARESQVACEYRQSGDVSVPDRLRTLHLYRIAQEAVTNAIKHAHAQRIELMLAGTPREVLLSVTDDGIGLPTTVPEGGLGLGIMAHRAETIGAQLAFQRPDEGGTCVACRVPRGDGRES